MDSRTQDLYRLLSESDLELIHALQLRPRASWTELGSALGVDPVTVARRWQRLSDRGEAWVSMSPGPRLLDQICVAYFEIDCAGSPATVARTLSRHPHIVTLEHSGGDHDLLATVAMPDLHAMSQYVLDVLPAVPGVVALRHRIATHMFAEGGSWRIDALTPRQRAQLAAGNEPRPARRAQPAITQADRALLALLACDGRASFQSLATALDTNAATVKRRLDQLLRLGLLRFRCDFARPLGGWPVAVTLWARVPPAELPDIGQALIQLPETRNCAAVSGAHNLIVQAGLHSIADVLRWETQLATTHPALDIAQRAITLRHEKLLGRLLDPLGRSIGTIAPDIWLPPAEVGL
ncbi:Lrp/AsnC family transcriptional regulator [Nocardia cyriacigeorgica]|uniref:Lrp/AsnC family transcriptional regulator n=1 Tax=Nocardia cyriacigeorgica TaxID=135487 RepID=A0A5R8PCE9_9NOCA|nr:Lrp/AsnC family transcriptional regulator [Nocardia cyriacigeorgica]